MNRRPLSAAAPVVVAQACHLSHSRAGKAETSRPATSEEWNHGRLLLVDEVLRPLRAERSRWKYCNLPSSHSQSPAQTPRAIRPAKLAGLLSRRNRTDLFR